MCDRPVRVVLKRTVFGDWRFWAEQKLFSKSNENALSGDGVIRLIGQFSRDGIGCKTRV